MTRKIRKGNNGYPHSSSKAPARKSSSKSPSSISSSSSSSSSSRRSSFAKLVSAWLGRFSIRSSADIESFNLEAPVLSAASFFRFARGERRESLLPFTPISDGVRLRNRFRFLGVDFGVLTIHPNRAIFVKTSEMYQISGKAHLIPL